MYSNSPYNYNQMPATGTPLSQLNQAAEMGTSFGYPMAPTPYGTQQFGAQPMMGGQAGMGQQIPTMPAQPMQVPITGAAPVDFDMLPTTPVLDVMYTQGYLKSQIGARVKVEFLIGTNMLIDREGTLVDVGISYIIINEIETDDLLLCDIYSIKFVRFYR
ncbi:MAG TPA: hypothetical protein VEB00_05575 [Clostridia bacterium]|nr:hypothetical protein [Clostridia bacterium]